MDLVHLASTTFKRVNPRGAPNLADRAKFLFSILKSEVQLHFYINILKINAPIGAFAYFNSPKKNFQKKYMVAPVGGICKVQLDGSRIRYSVRK